MNEEIEGSGLVAVYAAPTEMMAELVRVTLEAEGIPAVIGERVTSAYAPMLQVSQGAWGEVCVPASQEEAARAILASFDEGQGTPSSEELEAAAMAFPAPEDADDE